MPPLLGRFGARRGHMPDHPTTISRHTDDLIIVLVDMIFCHVPFFLSFPSTVYILHASFFI